MLSIDSIPAFKLQYQHVTLNYRIALMHLLIFYQQITAKVINAKEILKLEKITNNKK